MPSKVGFAPGRKLPTYGSLLPPILTISPASECVLIDTEHQGEDIDEWQ